MKNVIDFTSISEKMIKCGWTPTNNERVFISKDKKLIGRITEQGKLEREKNVRKKAKVIMKTNKVTGVSVQSNSQVEAILEHLETGNSLNVMESWENFGIYRLAAVIELIKEQGYEVFTRNSLVENNLGEFTYVAEYSFCEFDEEENSDIKATTRKDTHESVVLEALQRGSEMNSIVAMEEYGIMHLAAVIKNLRKQLHCIEGGENEIVAPKGEIRYAENYYIAQAEVA